VFEVRLAIVVVGGSAKDVGKTGLVCGLIAALREYAWTAVKITGHDYGAADPALNEDGYPYKTICEQTEPGPETDTARYLAAGARRALLVTRHGSELPTRDIRLALADDRNVIFESNRIVAAFRPDVCLALVGGPTGEVKGSFRRLLGVADALLIVKGAAVIPEAPAGILRFSLQSPNLVPTEVEKWLRERLAAPRSYGRN